MQKFSGKFAKNLGNREIVWKKSTRFSWFDFQLKKPPSKLFFKNNFLEILYDCSKFEERFQCSLSAVMHMIFKARTHNTGNGNIVNLLNCCQKAWIL